MFVGIISDTHNRFPTEVETVFSGVDIILHAGDIGKYPILEKLRAIAPTKAVYGNTDIYGIASTLPSKISFRLDKINFLLLHNIGKMRNLVWKIKRGDFQPPPRVIVYGHTHKPTFQEYMDYIFINPGSAGLPRGGIPPTVMILEIGGTKIRHHKIIHLKSDFIHFD